MADKAFLNGINDYKTIGDLRGCINDTKSIRSLLIDQFDFDSSNIRVRKDDRVTKSEMKKGWKWLLKDAAPGDRLVFHFSGHGSHNVDMDGDEPDHLDELLCLHGMDWNDPKTYLLDDELREWTEQIPDGVHVTFLMDCCHSGTNTRFVPPNISRAARTDFRSSGSLSLDSIAMQRAGSERQVRSALDDDDRGDEAGVRPADNNDIDESTVLARYAPPPPDVQVAIDKLRNKSSKRSTFRSLLGATRTRSGDREGMNHVLWSGCQDNQTSADAHINGDFHGAFSYYFCEAAREEGRDPNSKRVIRRLRRSLRDENFSQIPQLEPDETDGPLFGAQWDTPPEPSEEGGGQAGPPTAGEWQSLIDSLQQIVDQLGGATRTGVGSIRESGRALVYVHGICRHSSGYSDGWWQAMAPHLPGGLRQRLEANRHEVLWSEHVSPADRATLRGVDESAQRQMELTLQEILQERVVKEAEQQIVERNVGGPVRGLETTETRSITPEGPVPRAALGIPGLNCIDDFVKYLSVEAIRRAVIAEFTSKVEPLLRNGESVEVISHSWGTVVAFEALRALDRAHLPGRVHTWFTVGSALAISYVARQLRPGDGQKPSSVDRWINLDARGDAVGGSLQATGMQIDREYLRLPPVGCDDLFGLVTPACAHSSYFHPQNTAVNRDIFSRWIDRR